MGKNRTQNSYTFVLTGRKICESRPFRWSVGHKTEWRLGRSFGHILASLGELSVGRPQTILGNFLIFQFCNSK